MAIKYKDKEKVFALCELPIFLPDAGIEIKNKKQFLSNYDKIFTKAVIENINNGIIGFPLEEDYDDDKKGDIHVYSSTGLSTKEGLAMALLFRKIKGKIRFVGFSLWA